MRTIWLFVNTWLDHSQMQSQTWSRVVQSRDSKSATMNKTTWPDHMWVAPVTEWSLDKGWWRSMWPSLSWSTMRSAVSSTIRALSHGLNTCDAAVGHWRNPITASFKYWIFFKSSVGKNERGVTAVGEGSSCSNSTFVNFTLDFNHACLLRVRTLPWGTKANNEV